MLSNERYAGHTLHQKFYGEPTVPFKRHRNCGEYDQFYAENTHEAILATGVYEAVQRLLAARRKKTESVKTTNTYPLTSRIRCSECGSLYHRKTSNGVVKWVCSKHAADIIVLLYEAANTLRIEREAREEAARKREEEERQRNARRERYNQEIDRTNALVHEAEDFEIACKIRAYVSAVEQSGELTEEGAYWVKWARQKADWYDPTIEREDEFFGTREHGKSKDQKKLEKSYYS